MNATEAPIKPATIQPKLAPKPAKPAEWSMPRVRQSQHVIWFPDRATTESLPAIVTLAGDRAINVSIIQDGSYALLPKQGVRHKSDPDTDIIDRSEQGVWDFALSADALNATTIREIGVLDGMICAQACLIAEMGLKIMALEKAAKQE